ncbi:MAG: response regulator transcription factor [Pontiellaceae bacterium]|nr:response regulator transcription factor [Pontiellaceae bacterium]
MKIIFVESDISTNNNLQLLLEGEQNTEWAVGYKTVEEAIEQAPWDEATILLTDVILTDMSGIDLLSWVHENYPHINSMVFTSHDHHETVLKAIKAGACGYLLKSSSPRELIESLGQLVGGGAPMSPRIARQVILGMQQPEFSSTLPENLLTAREREILLYVEQGLAYKEIAEQLSISPHTVHTHVKKIYEKVEADGRQAVINKARRMGWI